MIECDGVYFGLSEDDYLAIDRLSKSGMKKLRVSPADFWASSWLNTNKPKLTPEQERRQEFAKVMGRAYHCAMLEPETFHARYVREISQSDFAGVDGFLFTGKDMEAALVELDLKKSGSVLDQAYRLAEGGYDRDLIWQLQKSDWEEDQGDRVAIPAEQWEQLEQDAATVELVPEVCKALRGGAAEVSVLWTCPATGLPLKARFDMLDSDRFVELKSFANPNGKNLEQCILDAIRFNRYHIDAAAYHEAAEAIRLGGLDIVGPCTDEQINIIAGIKERHEPIDCEFVFQQKGNVPNVLHRPIRLFEFAPQGRTERRTALHEKGRMEIKAAKRDFMAYSEVFGPGEAWLPINASREITDADFSDRWLEEI